MWPGKDYPYAKESSTPIAELELYKYTPEEKAKLLERMALIGKQHTDHYMANAWIENDSDGFTGWRWEKFNVPLRLVSAANRYKDIIICAPRHSSPLMNATIAAFGGIDILHEYGNNDNSKDCVQGFVDQYGTFYDRKTSLAMAIANGQLLYPDKVTPTNLFSEGLY